MHMEEKKNEVWNDTKKILISYVFLIYDTGL